MTAVSGTRFRCVHCLPAADASMVDCEATAAMAAKDQA